MLEQCYNCYIQYIIIQLKQKHHPPTFAELLLLLRTEEGNKKILIKDNRMKQHLGLIKAKALSNAQVLFPPEVHNYDATKQNYNAPSMMKRIQKQIADLQAQLSVFSGPKNGTPEKTKVTKENQIKRSHHI